MSETRCSTCRRSTWDLRHWGPDLICAGCERDWLLRLGFLSPPLPDPTEEASQEV